MIVCLLVVFKSTSQTATKDSVVVLNETVAREVVKDLVRYDVCRQVSNEQAEVIELQKSKLTSYKSIIEELEYQKEQSNLLISNQNKIIDRLKSPKLHLYVGIRNENFNLTTNSVFANLLFCTRKIDVGLHATTQVNGIITYGVISQYKVF